MKPISNKALIESIRAEAQGRESIPDTELAFHEGMLCGMLTTTGQAYNNESFDGIMSMAHFGMRVIKKLKEQEMSKW